MDKLISQLTASGSNLQDVDLAEGQISGEVFTRKFTGLQFRAVEKAEREAQDNVIEAGCGLQANGTYLPEANSWSLRAGDFTAGCTDRGGATGSLTPSIQNALRLLDAKMNAMGSGNYVILKANLNADTTLTTIVPAGYMLTYVVFLEKAGTIPVLDLGSTVGGNDVFISQTLKASGLTPVFCPSIFSLSAATTLYLNHAEPGSNWNGSTVDAYFVMTPILAGILTGGVAIMGYYEYDCACNVPTNVMITACIGAASDYAAGSVFLIKESNGGCGAPDDYTYFVMSRGGSWQVNNSQFIPAV